MGETAVSDIGYRIMASLMVQLHDVLDRVLYGTEQYTDADLRILREVLDATSAIIVDIVGYF